MKKRIAIIAGEPNSVNSEIIAKAWKKKKKLKNIFVIGNYFILITCRYSVVFIPNTKDFIVTKNLKT